MILSCLFALQWRAASSVGSSKVGLVPERESVTGLSLLNILLGLGRRVVLYWESGNCEGLR
jgi:hypothetical protein